MATSLSTTSLSGLGLSGLSSGLDTSGIISKLMAIESAPKTQLQSKLSDTATYRTALQSLNTSVAAIATSATAAAKTGALASFTAASDTASVTASASSTASAGALSFTVDRLAAAQVSVTQAMSTLPPQLGTITVRTGPAGATKDTPITFTSTNLDDAVAAINTSGAGVTASKIPVGSVNGVQQYRLQLRSATGADNAFTVSLGGTYSSDASSTIGLTKVTEASDAQVTLYKGIAGAEQQVHSATNTFDDLLTGVDVTVAATTTSAATVSIAADSTAASTAAQTLVASLSTLFSGIASATAITTSAGDNGTTSTTGSVFTGDSTVRSLKDALLSAATNPVNGNSPSSIGIVLTKDGTVTFDQAKFTAAMHSDSAGTTAMFQTIANGVGAVATAASDSVNGTLTQKITSQQSTESTLTKEISDWTDRLATIQAQYTTQFNNLETALNSLSSQGSYLTSQIAGLTTNYQNK